jgi:hypothetical protein
VGRLTRFVAFAAAFLPLMPGGPALAIEPALHWSDRFGVRSFLDTWPNTYERVTPGADGVYTGPFQLVGDEWNLLADPDCAQVYATAASGDQLYIAGGLCSEGRGNIVARWDGDHWTTIAQKIDAPVRAMVIHEGALYVGGWFHADQNFPAMGVARWDGEKWSALGDHYLALIGELAFVGDVLYAAGGGWLYRWDGVTWTEIGVGDGSIWSLFGTGTDLYLGGGFTYMRDLATDEIVKAMHIARWDGQAFHPLGAGLGARPSSYLFPEFDEVNAIVEYDGEIVAGGLFSKSGSLSMRNLARWNGSRWVSFGDGAEYRVDSMAVYDGDLYIGAWGLRIVDGVAVKDFAKWNGTSWSPIGDWGSTLESVTALEHFDGDLYASGAFLVAGGTPAAYVAAWDGVAWHEVGGGTDGLVWTMETYGSDLLAGGLFTRAGDRAAAGIARWNGSEWSAVGEGIRAGVQGLAVDGATIYASSYDAETWTHFLSKWNGAGWERFAEADSWAGTMAVFDHELFVAGGFEEIGGIAAHRFAKFDGSQWHPLGDEFAGEIQNLVLRDDELWVVGWFQYNQAPSVAVWDGSAWQSMESPQYLDAVVSSGDRTFGGGGGLWSRDDGVWAELEKISVFELAANDAQLYVSGYFYSVAGVPSREFAALALADCGNGVLDDGEACDPGILGSTCCDMDDCTIAESGRICHPARGPCDLDERCDGISTTCPDDLIAGNGAPCVTYGDDCGGRFCDGVGLSCPLDEYWNPGGECASCGDADEDSDVDATDAMISLRSAVGLGACPVWLCDHDGSGQVAASDALRILRVAVGIELTALCPTHVSP